MRWISKERNGKYLLEDLFAKFIDVSKVKVKKIVLLHFNVTSQKDTSH